MARSKTAFQLDAPLYKNVRVEKKTDAKQGYSSEITFHGEEVKSPQYFTLSISLSDVRKAIRQYNTKNALKKSETPTPLIQLIQTLQIFRIIDAFFLVQQKVMNGEPGVLQRFGADGLYNFNCK